MNKIHLIGFRGLFEFVRRLLPLGLAFAVLPVLAVEPKPPVAAEPKTHTLFMGADMSVEQNKKLYRVQDVVAGGFVIKVDGKEVRIAADWASVILKVERSLKLTGTEATVANLKSERTYTVGNDPVARFERGLAATQLNYAESVAAQNQVNVDFNQADVVLAASGPPDAHAPAIVAQKQIQAQQRKAQSTLSVRSAVNSSLNKGDSIFDGEGMFDAMEVTFEVSSEQTMTSPYVVILGQYRELDAKPGTVANWVYAQPLQPISSSVRKVHLVRGGFPRGFEMLDLQVHLYNRGREIATDVAPKRVPLTRDEAFSYLFMEYLSGHKGATLPASPIIGKLAPTESAQLSTEQLEQAYYVKVAKNGLPVNAFSDSNCSKPVDGVVGNQIRNVRFYPALENGKPVEGVAELKFSRLNL